MLNKLKQWLKSDKKESRGIYNVSFNEKRATPIYKDIEIIENTVIEYIAMYIRGYHNNQRDKGIGAEHIKIHLEQGSKGEIKIEELLNLGNSIRAYLKEFKEPFVDDKGGKLYEWQDEAGVRFRVVTDEIKTGISPCDNCTATYALTNQGTSATSIADTIITFYSDRNLNERMEFKNPKVEEYFKGFERSEVAGACDIKDNKKESRGMGFNVTNDKESKSDYNIKMEVVSNVRNIAKLDIDTIIADLEFLNKKHPEMFKKPSDVFRLIRDIKENPTYFYKNNVPNIALIAKRLKDNKLGKLGIHKNSGEVRHLTKSGFIDKENARLLKRDGISPLVESPYSTQLVLSNNSKPTAMVQNELSKGKLESNNIQKESTSQAQNLTQELLTNYGHINRRIQDKFTQIEKQTSDNLACASGIDDTALNTLKTKGEKDLSIKHNNEIKEKKNTKDKIMKNIVKNILTLFFTIFLINTSAYAYEKSGFFIGLQGSILQQQKTNTDTNYNVEVIRNTEGTTTTSGSTTNKGYFGGGWFSDKSGSFSTVSTSNVYMSLKSFFSQDIILTSDKPYSFGGILGYKKIFQQSVNARQFVGNGFHQNAMGMRYYVNFDISARGKNGKYSSQMINGNIDVLYNLFPQYSFWDFGVFAGVSVGYVRHKLPIYEVKGLDYGLNFGVRWTVNKRHNIELFGRVGLSTLERRSKNDKAEHYYFADLSSSIENKNEDGSGVEIDYDIESPGNDKIYVGVINANQQKTSVDAYYGNDSKVYYKNTSSGEYVIINGEVKAYNATEHAGLDRYSHAYVTENGLTSNYYWDYDETGTNKKIYLSSSQSTYGGGTASQVIKSEQILKSRPIDTIEEFKNPFRFGIRYTFTF